MSNPEKNDFDCQVVPLEGTLLLEASAGTGKTWNLVRIVNRLITEQSVPAEKLLLVTFTNDAVNELRNRQREITPETGQMTITTIHGFCGALLQQLPFESGVPFRLEPSQDDGGLLLESVRDFIRDGSLRADPEADAEWGRLLLKKGDAGAVNYLCKGLKPFVEDPVLRLTGTPDGDTGLKKLFRQLTDRVLPALREQKKRRGIVDFSGMIDLVHTLVTGNGPESEAFIKAVRNRFRAALIDEFQDTDSRQWDIFRILFDCPGHSLILIGDPKQSIYGFRGSDLTQYLKARESVDPLRRYLLRSNFRSTQPVIDAFGELFTPLFRDYPPQNKGDKTVLPLLDPRGKPARPLMFIPLEPETAAVGVVRKKWFVTVTDRIGTLIGEGWRLGDRPVCAADFLILIDRNTHGEMIRGLLRERGILAVTCSGSSVVEETEAAHFLRLMAALAEPDRRGPVCGALLSVFFRLSPDQVYRLEQEGGLDRVHTLFAAWKEQVDRGDLAGVVEEVFAEGPRLYHRLSGGSGAERLPLPEQLLGEPGGERTLTNIRHLTELYQEELRRGGLDSRRLYQRLMSGRLRFSDGETREIRLDREGNCVRIMTVFKAKGLEAPLVIYAGGLGRIDKPGFPSVWLDESRGCRCFSPDPDAEEKKQKAEASLKEFLRLFYVALTRAASALWLPLPSQEVLASAYTAYGSLYKALTSVVAGGDADAALTDRMDAFVVSLEKRGLAEVLPLQDRTVADPTKAVGFAAAVTARLVSPGGRLPVNPEKRIKPVASFTSMTRAAEAATHGSEPTPDDRDRAPEISPEKRAALRGDDPLAGLAGPVFGELVHGILEELDLTLAAGHTEEEFRELEEVRRIVSLALRRYYPADRERLFYPPVTGLVYRVLTVSVPQAGGRPLCALSPEKIIREMEFLYPDPDTADGFIKGYIDLIFEAEGKIFLADWKTNLPESDDPRAPFDREMMEKVMKTHHYHRQADLYRTALLRYMEKSGIPRERYAGTLYFFLRGMDKEGRGLYFIGNDR